MAGIVCLEIVQNNSRVSSSMCFSIFDVVRQGTNQTRIQTENGINKTTDYNYTPRHKKNAIGSVAQCVAQVTWPNKYV